MASLKYVDSRVVFREVPGEVTLAVDVAGCPVHCPGCHSPWLWEDAGTPLDAAVLRSLIGANPGVTCVAILGGDADPVAVMALLRSAKAADCSISTCWYSGRTLHEVVGYVNPQSVDYLKVGPYIAALGPLDAPSTNQRMYRVTESPTGATHLEDMTHLFNRNHNDDRFD